MFTGGSLIVGLGRPHRPGLRGPHRGARPRPVRVAAPAGRPARATCRCGPPTAPARSARHRRARSARSTIGRELATNPLLPPPTKTPSWHSCSAPRAAIRPTSAGSARSTGVGPPLLDGDPTLAPLSVDEVRGPVGRRRGAHRCPPGGPLRRRAHVRGAISIPLRPVFATWLGWLAPTRPTADDHRARPGSGPGRDRLAGRARSATTTSSANSTAEWRRGPPRATTSPASRWPGPEQLDGRRVLDIRQRSEFLDGHLPGAMHVELGDIAAPRRGAA